MSDSGRWLDLADEDRQVAQLAYKARIYNQACFHAQQGTEKCLKAFLIDRDGKFPKTHSLVELLMLASVNDKALLQLKDECLYLDQFYVPTRYPDAPLGSLPEGEPNREDAKKAMEILQKIMSLVLKRVAKE